MAISPVNLTRVSHNLQTDFVLSSLRRTQRDLFLSQTQIATGRRFVTPSEDPIAAARALDLSRAIDQQRQFMANAQEGDNVLVSADSALTEIADLMIQASVIANEMVNSLSTEAEREAEAEIVARIRQQLVTVANRTFNGRHVFAGLETLTRPFVDALGGVAYMGDLHELATRVDDRDTTAISVTGNVLFGALSRPIDSDVDLTPNLTPDTRLDAIIGATGTPIERGVLAINEIDGAGVISIDLRDADTIGDVADLINAAAMAASSTLSVSVGDEGLTMTPGGAAITISDNHQGVVAASLGILVSESQTGTITGSPLVPRITRLTPVDALAGGSGFDLEGGFIITNGGQTVTVDISSSETVQDVINTINNAGAFVLARISDDGTRIDMFNQVSGSTLTIGENGGTTATDLGIRTLDTATRLDRLNFDLGVTAEAGKDDFRITAKDGSTVDVNIDGAETIGDVIDLINEAATDASVTLMADFSDMGNGIRITDGTGGSGTLSVSLLNLSTAAMDLGLVQVVDSMATELIGADVNPTRTDGIIGALIELENALRSNNTQAISIVGGRLDDLRSEVTRIHGVIGARSQAMTSKVAQLRDAVSTTQLFLSEVQDLDYAEAVTRMQSALIQMQANLQASSTLLNVSLLNFLR